EPYNMYDLTAAHPTLPLGSFVRVTNLRNGRSVVVKVNDRGPIVPGRIIDVSYSTARVLQFKAQGLQRVRLDLVQPKMAQPQIVCAHVAESRRIFLDRIYHDIPTTVVSTVRVVVKIGVSRLTVHASGGSKMLRAAVEAASSVNLELTILGVTALTSMGETVLE